MGDENFTKNRFLKEVADLKRKDSSCSVDLSAAGVPVYLDVSIPTDGEGLDESVLHQGKRLGISFCESMSDVDLDDELNIGMRDTDRVEKYVITTLKKSGYLFNAKRYFSHIPEGKDLSQIYDDVEQASDKAEMFIRRVKAAGAKAELAEIRKIRGEIERE